MKFTESLKKNEEFKRAYKTGRSHVGRTLVLYQTENGTQRSRLGITVSSKVGNSVVRHRVTRLIREAYRLHEEEFLPGLDLVVVARGRAAHATYGEIESALLQAADQLDLRQKDAESGN